MSLQFDYKIPALHRSCRMEYMHFSPSPPICSNHASFCSPLISDHSHTARKRFVMLMDQGQNTLVGVDSELIAVNANDPVMMDMDHIQILITGLRRTTIATASNVDRIDDIGNVCTSSTDVLVGATADLDTADVAEALGFAAFGAAADCGAVTHVSEAVSAGGDVFEAEVEVVANECVVCLTQGKGVVGRCLVVCSKC